jgi:hypothetical protein
MLVRTDSETLPGLVVLVVFAGRRRASYIFDVSQPPDSEANDLNHPEAELILQAINETEVGFGEPNRC